ncbi:F-box/LRR-repeat protein 6 isoform X1 [Odocoileus virginianus]|uniref:F-box/LRR-repeat protein 6 isoform X1 n=1 Tax=Odocoileus virginianus TaxID=9874 RepID=A0ABM4HY24_ODOVR
MASGAAGLARPARRRVRLVHPAAAQTRSAEDWWWDRLAPSGSGYHLLQSDSMLLVLPGPGPARLRAQRRVARQARRLRSPGSRAAEAKPSSAPAPTPLQEPDPGWGDRVPLEILLQIFGLLVAADGPIPFLGRAARVCRRWNEAASQPALWHTLTLSPPLAGRPAKSGAKAEKKLLSSLEWLMPNRFSQLQRLTLIHWKSQLVSESCPRLTFLKLSDCHGVTLEALIMLAKACPQLHSLDIQHSMVKSTAVVSFLEEAGPRMRKLWLTYNPQTTAILGALLGSCCPQLQVLEVSTGLSHNITPFQLPVEALQKGCPQLQVLRLLNLTWLPKPSGRVITPGPGFPSLEELCLASSTCNFVSNEVLGRLLHGSPHLRLLDLRGCARITPAGLHDLPCQKLEQLYLGLYGMSDRLTLAKEGSPLLTQKWCHSLRELDLSGQGFSEKDLEQALAVFSGTPGCSQLALCSLNLRGTRVTPGTLCDKQLPRSAVPQLGILPLPSPGPEAGLQRPRGSPMVPGAAAHQPPLPQLGSSRPLCQPALPCLFSQFWIFECFVIIKPFLELLCGLWDQSEGTGVVPEGTTWGYPPEFLSLPVAVPCQLPPGLSVCACVTHPRALR